MADKSKGLIFDIEEFSVYDGPGIRTSVFFKGCPLRCVWCHNPEGLNLKTEAVVNPNRCNKCGKCYSICKNKGKRCEGCGECLDICPQSARRLSGENFSAESLIEKLKKNMNILNSGGGGVTFTGGECTMQSDFIISVLSRLKGCLHTAIQTCGFCDSDKFNKIAELADFIMFDLKILNEDKAKELTGQGSSLILKNFRELKKLSTPYIVRVPLIPSITDTEENLVAIAKEVSLSNAEYVELLPYNKFAGSKYLLLNREYNPPFDEKAVPFLGVEIFKKFNVTTKIY